MPTKISLFISLLAPFLAFSQAEWKTPDALQICAGTSSHGTGDLPGILLGFSYEHRLSRMFDWMNGVTITQHNEPSYNFESASGVQLNSIFHLNLNLVSKSSKRVRLGLGPILRYENAIHPSGYTILGTIPGRSPGLGGLYVEESDRMNTLSVGYGASVGFLAELARKYQLGFQFGFQNDTNGAVITQISLLFGRYVKFAKNER